MDNLEELEAHLRDAVAMMQERGLSQEEAFIISTRRIGNVPALQSEFTKMNVKEVWLNRLFWMLAGVLLWSGVTTLSSLAATSLLLAGLWGTGHLADQTGWIYLGLLFTAVHLSFKENEPAVYAIEYPTLLSSQSNI